MTIRVYLFPFLFIDHFKIHYQNFFLSIQTFIFFHQFNWPLNRTVSLQFSLQTKKFFSSIFLDSRVSSQFSLDSRVFLQFPSDSSLSSFHQTLKLETFCSTSSICCHLTFKFKNFQSFLFSFDDVTENIFLQIWIQSKFFNHTIISCKAISSSTLGITLNHSFSVYFISR